MISTILSQCNRIGILEQENSLMQFIKSFTSTDVSYSAWNNPQFKFTFTPFSLPPYSVIGAPSYDGAVSTHALFSSTDFPYTSEFLENHFNNIVSDRFFVFKSYSFEAGIKRYHPDYPELVSVDNSYYNFYFDIYTKEGCCNA